MTEDMTKVTFFYIMNKAFTKTTKAIHRFDRKPKGNFGPLTNMTHTANESLHEIDHMLVKVRNINVGFGFCMRRVRR